MTGVQTCALPICYSRYQNEIISDKIKFLPQFTRNKLIKPFFNSLQYILNPDYHTYKKINAINKRLSEVDKDEIERYTERFIIFDKNDFGAYLQFNYDQHGLKNYYKPLKSKLKSRLLFDQNTSLSEDMLTKVDRVTMANSLEARVPFLDYRIVEFSYKIPDSLLISGLKLKTFLKYAFQGILPNNILYRRKHGFATPIDHWIRYDLKELVSDTLLSESNNKIKYLNFNNIIKLVNEHFNGISNNGHKIFMLMVFVLWYKRWIS